jgi:rod shape-determining protein MreC
VPRNRTARLAVLPPSVQRSTSAPYSARTTAAFRRRTVAAVLVVLSLALISVYFRESDGGALHGAQNAGATVLRPFQVAAERVAQPFRDVYGYFAGLVHAKSEADRLRAQVQILRQQVIQNEFAARQNQTLRGQLRYRAGAAFPQGYEAVSTEVIAQQPSQYEQRVVINAGTKDGVRRGDAVVTPKGLVGKVSLAFTQTARVTLLTDEDSAVSAVDLATDARGIVRHGHGASDSNSLFFDRVPKEEEVHENDLVYTAGWRSGALTSLYPKGIGIGFVSSVDQYDTDLFKQIQVTPFVDFSELDAVIVLASKNPAPLRR